MHREYVVSFSKVQHGRRQITASNRPTRPKPIGRVPRVARMLALAHHFDRLIGQGVVKDYAEIARLTQLSRARVTQIMTLKFLTPAIQEEIAWLPNSRGKDALLEKDVRRIALLPEWGQQQDTWQRLTGQNDHQSHEEERSDIQD
ncbi:MAG: hypothetical protein ACYDCO_01405 [Armatimonadota bacterium]